MQTVPLFLLFGGNIVDEIIVIRAADPDGSIFRAVVDVLRDKKGTVTEVIPPASPVLRVGELEIHHEYRRVLMAGGKCGSTTGNMPCFTAWPVHQGKCSQRHSSMRRPGEKNTCMGRTPWKISSGG